MSYYDETAEKAIIGAAVSNARITGSIKLTEPDFAQPIHGAIWEAITKAHADGLKPDPTTITARLRPGINPAAIRALLVEVVGLGIVSNADAYAATIRDRAERRRIESTLAGIRQRLDNPDLPADDILAYAETKLLTTTGLDQAVETLWTLDEFLDRDLPDIEWVIPDLLATGERLVLTGTEGLGKALALDTPIPTPGGWTTMGDLRDGEKVLGADGRPVTVVHALPVQYGRPCYRVRFSDGSSIIADERHEWLTETLRAREAAAKYARKGDTPVRPRGTNQRHKRLHFPEIVETARIRETLRARGGHSLNHSVATCPPLDLPEADLPIDPYTFGAWLGDGSSTHAVISTHPNDAEILDKIRSAGYTVRKRSGKYSWSITRQGERSAARHRVAELVATGVSRRKALGSVGLDRRSAMPTGVRPITSLATELRAVGVLNSKHIPDVYLRGSYAQRLALLQGLMDTDGTINANGSCEFTGCSERLAANVFELMQTLGIKARMRESAAKLNGREVGRRWRISFCTDLPIFHLSRKAERIRAVSRRAKLRYITAVEPVESVPVRCIEVDAEDHLYLAGRSFIPTHNSIVMRQIGACVAAGLHPFTLRTVPARKVLLVDCENPERIMMAKLGDLRRVIRTRGTDAGTRFTLKRYPQGLNLADAKERLDLHHILTVTRPDLLLIGPAYKLYVGGSNAREEDLARLVTSHLDGLREEFGFALILEHHSPHGGNDGQQRSVRPIGSSLWLRWPEFGLGLRPEKGTGINARLAELVPWRGARDERPWPRRLHGGQPGELPWIDPDSLRRAA